jgi:hypothetical protein
MGHYEPKHLFGKGKSDELLLDILRTDDFWNISKQKLFNDLSKNI